MATDAEIRAQGINFLSPQRYLQNPYQLPTEEVVEETGGGIPQTQAFTNSGGNNFSVYNPDPNSLPSYRPNYDYRQFSEYGSDPSTTDIKQMDMNQEYFNAPPGNPKLQGLMGMIPYVGSFARGAKFLGNQIGPYIPPNRRAIMENELAGKGVMVNDIGQIVQGSGAYDDASGKNVMAGYNPAKMTAATFDNRLASLGNMSDDARAKREAAIEAAKENFLKTQNKSDKIVDFEEEEKKKLREKTIIGKFMTNKKKKKADKIAKDAQDKINAAAVNSPDNYGVQGLQRSGSYGGNDTYSGQGSTVSSSGDVTNKDGSTGNINDEFAKGGRVGYFFGGRVNYKVGGRVGFKNGGLASIL